MHRVNGRHEGLIHNNIPIFMEGIYETNFKKLTNYDIAFIGIPLDYGVSYRRGTFLGPKVIREYSVWEKVILRDFYDTESEKIITSNNLKIADYGDIFVIPTDTKKTEKFIQETIFEIRKKTFPVIVGGDHSIAYSTIKGCFNALPKNLKDDFAVLHIDAHLDTEDSYEGVSDTFHGNPFKLLIDEGILKGENLYSIGIRGVIPKYLYDFTVKNNINLYTSNKIRKIGFDNFLLEIIDKLKKYKAVYITFDIDSIDPKEVVGTGTPVANGLFSNEIEKLFRNLNEVNVVGFELVEVAPEYDNSSYSAIVGVNCIWNFLSFGLKNNGKLPNFIN